MKEKYEAAEIDVVILDSEDIITNSCLTETGEL